MKKKVLICGINGFLGSALSYYLQKVKKGPCVLGIARRTSPHGYAQVLACDLDEPKRLQVVLQRSKPDIIFHFAGGRFSDDQKTFDANFMTTKTLLETVKGLKDVFTPKVIIPGSAAEYGNIQGKRLIAENCLPKPLSWYGFVKLLQSDLGLFYARQGLDVTVVRMFNICGKHTPATLALGGFAQQIVAIEQGAVPVIKTKNLDGKRDFCDVEDICRGLWMIAQKGRKGEIYNMCSAKAVTIRELLHTMLHYAKVKDIRVEENRQDASFSFDVIGANAKFKSAVPWIPRVSLEQSLKQTLESYRTGIKRP